MHPTIARNPVSFAHTAPAHTALAPQVMCKMGAIMAAGILDAGGRNCTVGLRSRSGYFRRTSVVGLAVFTQYWWVGWGKHVPYRA